MDSPMIPQVSQSLFIRHGFDGSSWEFAALADGGCALLRDGSAVTTADGTEPSVEQLLQEFFRVTTAYAVEVPCDEADAVVPGETELSPQAA
jgi:hypothetical protein